MPYRIDLFSIFIFLGIVQAVFLCFFFFSKEGRKTQSNIFLGVMLLCMAGTILEIFLMYTGYITQCLYLVDFSEALSVAIGPTFYLMVLSTIYGRVEKKQYLHFVFPFIYFLLELPFLLLPNAVKYNAWVESYRPDLTYLPNSCACDSRMFWLTNHATETIIITLFLYGILGVWEVIKAFKKRKESFWKPKNPTLKKLQASVLIVTSSLVLVLIIKFFNKNDMGDHYFAAYISITIYALSFRVIRESGFFKQPSLAEPVKYKSSTVTEDLQLNLIERMREVMNTKKPFLQPDFSLPEMAQLLNTSVHSLSQVINDGLGKTFFEMVAEYRIHEAKILLKEKRHIKVEEIAEQVGYNSKSSFNTAFKKITGQTPSDFRAS